VRFAKASSHRGRQVSYLGQDVKGLELRVSGDGRNSRRGTATGAAFVIDAPGGSGDTRLRLDAGPIHP